MNFVFLNKNKNEKHKTVLYYHSISKHSNYLYFHNKYFEIHIKNIYDLLIG